MGYYTLGLISVNKLDIINIMRIKKVKIRIDPEDLVRRIEKEINKEVTIKVPIKGIKVEIGKSDDWSWVVGILILAALLAMGWKLGQNEKTIRQLIEQKYKIEMQTPVFKPTEIPTPTLMPTIILTPTPTVGLRKRR
jgi:hypothetical protein